MRFVLFLVFLSMSMGFAVPANANTCNAGHGCTITCTDGCGCVYMEGGSCNCYCEPGPPGQANANQPSIDFQGIKWSTVSKDQRLLNLLKQKLKGPTINCLARTKGPLTVQAAPDKGPLQGQIGPVCQ